MLFRPETGRGVEDPHGLIGDPAYDAANLLYNPLERQDLRTDPARARRLAEVLAPAVQRPVAAVLGYGFCHACLSAACWLSPAPVSLP